MIALLKKSTCLSGRSQLALPNSVAPLPPAGSDASPPPVADNRSAALHEARANIQRVVTRLEDASCREFDAVDEALERRNFPDARRRLDVLNLLLELNIDLVETADQLEGIVLPEQSRAPAPQPTPTEGVGVLTFVVGSMSFAGWHALLMPPEKELCLSGVEVTPGVFSLDQAIPIKPIRASTMGFQPDPESIYQALKRFGTFGYGLRAFIHSHPGTGSSSTRPSSRDLQTQRNLETRYRCIGLITNEEGYLRPFADQLPFKLTVYGQKVEMIDEQEQLYRIHLE